MLVELRATRRRCTSIAASAPWRFTKRLAARQIPGSSTIRGRYRRARTRARNVLTARPPMTPKSLASRKRDRQRHRPYPISARRMETAVLRSLMVASVIAVGCTAMALPAQAQSRETAMAPGHMGVHIQQTRPVTVTPNGVTPRQFDNDHRRPPHHHFGPFVPFGFWGGFESPGTAAVAEPPNSESDAPSLGATRLDADRPPCHETTPQGVEILRGSGCSRAAH